jgi:hypothetical protein
MRSASGILLGLIILFNLAGLPVVFKCQQLRIRREMKIQARAGIPKEKLHCLSFPLEEVENLHWTRKGKEFFYDNEMYDIVFSKKEGGIIHYYCLNDKEEKSLLARLNELIGRRLKEDLRTGKNISGKLARAISSLIFVPPAATPSIASIDNSISHNSRFNCNLTAPYLEFDSPPPKFP